MPYILEVPITSLLMLKLEPQCLELVCMYLGVQNYWNARRAELQDLYREFGEIEIRRDMNQMYRITLPGNRFFWMFKEISNFLQDIFFGCGFATADDLRELVRRHSLRRDSIETRFGWHVGL